MNNKRNGIILIVAGIICAALFTFIFINSDKKAKSYDEVATAIEIDNNCREEIEEGETKNICQPKYTFQAGEGEYVCESKTSSNVVNGKKNKVYYDSKDPEKCMTEFDMKNNKLSLVGTGIGILLIIGGFVTLFKKGEEE